MHSTSLYFTSPHLKLAFVQYDCDPLQEAIKLAGKTNSMTQNELMRQTWEHEKEMHRWVGVGAVTLLLTHLHEEQ